jgi:hypothetical protein
VCRIEHMRSQFAHIVVAGGLIGAALPACVQNN